MKNILILANEFPPEIGGAGVVAKDIAEILSSNNYKVTVMTLCHKNKIKGNKYIIYKIKSPPKFYPIFYFLRILSTGIHNYDKIILNDLGGTLAASFFFTKNIQKKCIVYLHGDEPKDIYVDRSFLNKIFGFTSRFINLINNCQNIIAVSNFILEKFLIYSGNPHLREKSIVIHNGIMKSLFFPARTNLYDLYSISSKKMLILTVSRIVEGKGFLNMYQIFKRLIDQGIQYHWIIVGDGAYKSALLTKISADNFSNNITIIHPVERSDLKIFYSSVDVFWLLSNFEESLGLVYLEAAACGTPSIGRNAFGVIEAIKNGVSGFLVNSDEECYELLQKADFNKLDRDEILKYSEKYDINNSITKLIHIL